MFETIDSIIYKYNDPINITMAVFHSGYRAVKISVGKRSLAFGWTKFQPTRYIVVFIVTIISICREEAEKTSSRSNDEDVLV